MTPTGLEVFEKGWEVVAVGDLDVAGVEQGEERIALLLDTRSTKGSFAVLSTTL